MKYLQNEWSLFRPGLKCLSGKMQRRENWVKRNEEFAPQRRLAFLRPDSQQIEAFHTQYTTFKTELFHLRENWWICGSRRRAKSPVPIDKRSRLVSATDEQKRKTNKNTFR